MKRKGFLLALSVLLLSASAYANVFVMVTQTACDRDSDTDDTILAKIFGTSGTSGWQDLDNSDNNFERCKQDAFAFQTNAIGEVSRVDFHIRGEDGWLFNWFTIEDITSHRVWTFENPNRNWLDTDGTLYCRLRSDDPSKGLCSPFRGGGGGPGDPHCGPNPC
jgi:PLAT/LH2 domain